MAIPVPVGILPRDAARPGRNSFAPAICADLAASSASPHRSGGAETIDRFYALSDRDGWVLGETFERAHRGA